MRPSPHTHPQLLILTPVSPFPMLWSPTPQYLVTYTDITVGHTHEGPCGASCDLTGSPGPCWLTGALFRYVQHYGLGEACDDVGSVLKRVAVKLGKTQKVKVLTGTGETRGLGDLSLEQARCP